MLQRSLLSVHLVVAKDGDQHEHWSAPPRKDPEQKFRRLGSKHSGGNYTYRKHSWWSGKQKRPCLPLRHTGLMPGHRLQDRKVSSPKVVCAEAPSIRLRDRDERVNNLWGELAALNERLAGGDPVFARKRIDYLR